MHALNKLVQEIDHILSVGDFSDMFGLDLIESRRQLKDQNITFQIAKTIRSAWCYCYHNNSSYRLQSCIDQKRILHNMHVQKLPPLIDRGT